MKRICFKFLLIDKSTIGFNTNYQVSSFLYNNLLPEKLHYNDGIKNINYKQVYQISNVHFFIENYKVFDGELPEGKLFYLRTINPNSPVVITDHL